MNVKFIFPPFSRTSLNGPYLAPFMLSAILNSKKIKSEAVDLNIQMIHKLLSKNVISNILKTKIEAADRQFLELYLKRNKLRYFIWNSAGLISFLGILRKHCFPSPGNISECFSKKNTHHKIISGIYRQLIIENELHHADIVGISIAFPEQFAEAVLLSKHIRKLNKSCRIVAGGCQINMMDEKDIEFISKQGIFDVTAKGNFDQEITGLIRSISKNKYKKIIHAQNEKCCSTDKFPKVDFGDTEKYFLPLTLPVLVSKGCWWGKCVFCDYRRLNEHYSVRTPEDVFADISFIQLKKPEALLYLISDAVSPAWYKKLCKMAIQENQKINTWSYMIHSGKLDKPFFKLLAQAGVQKITFGTENTIGRVLSSMNKNFSFDIIARNLKDAAASGISNSVNIIPDFPGTTYEEAKKNILQLNEISGSVSILNIQPFVLNSGTEISKKPDEFHIHIRGDAGNLKRGFHGLGFSDRKGMKPAQKKEILDELTRLSGRIHARPILNKIFISLNNESLLYFNPIVFSDTHNKHLLFNLFHNSVHPITKWERAIFRELFCTRGDRISLADLSSLFHQYYKGYKTSFSGWFIKLVSNFIISDIK
jgi:hypothetical protein